MSKGIKLLIMSFLNESIIIASWGITKIKIQDEKLAFEVNGLIYKGSIIICEYGTCYSIEMNGEKLICNLDNIISILDGKIERTNNYDEDLLEVLIK